MEHVIMATFPVESEAYQAFTELKHNPVSSQSLILQAMLIKKQNRVLAVSDVYDAGANSGLNLRKGGLIGGALGILGGPLGLLIGAGVGALAGAGAETASSMKKRSILDRVSGNLSDDTVAILALAQETDEMEMDAKFGKYGAIITRYDAAEVQDEVEEAARAQREVEKATRDIRYKDASEERRAKVDAARTIIVSEFNELKEKLKSI